MPSYRVTMTIGALRPGSAAPAVMPLAAQAAKELTTVEASELTIVAGAPRVIVRYTAEDAELAAQIGAHTAAVTGTVAEVRTWMVTQRVDGRWRGVAE
ncbi:hypothetical protein B0I08_101737 [Glaciihabitans tibetensis]|uniref:Uncharacterized protein n=1 Tax=Glaciihabitans tibetensis TaxID=1266600 RepID=A0A2T0VK42_9MICO|nr:hypothetical protein [Glaciihabitans tibetensis]PRY70600.1 hypothetical protein B0I08_101737 [Glaciihabitans tibetensis]